MAGNLYIWQLIVIFPIFLIVLLAFVAAGIRIVKVISLNKKFDNNIDLDYSCLYGGKNNIENYFSVANVLVVVVKDVNLVSIPALKEVKAKHIKIEGNNIRAEFKNIDLVIKRMGK